jgi:CCR4-NOT transcription complex subunit 1
MEWIGQMLSALTMAVDHKQFMPNLLSALAFLIEKCSAKDVTRFCQIVRLVMQFADCSALLHYVRPLRCPAVGLGWIELITNREFVGKAIERGVSYAVLLLDFTAALGYLVGCVEKGVFEIVYKAYLRWIAIVGHDYPDFICDIQMELVALLPADFIQLRNVILSIYPSNMTYLSPLTPDLKIDHLPYVQEVRLRCLNDKPSLAIEQWVRKMIQGEIADVEYLRSLKGCEISRIVNRAFELSQADLVKDSFLGSWVFNGFCEILKRTDCDLGVMFLDSFIDELRFPCRNTHFFCKLLLEMFKRDLVGKDGESIAEVIVMRIARRAAVLPPFPWGLKVIIMELMGNPELGFWEMNSVKIDERVRKLLKAIHIVVCTE